MDDYILEDFKKFLGENGKGWLRDVTDEQVNYFIDWARKTQVFALSDNDPDWLGGDTRDAFRGFCVGLKFYNNKDWNKDWNKD